MLIQAVPWAYYSMVTYLMTYGGFASQKLVNLLLGPEDFATKLVQAVIGLSHCS
jgi:hypothetical protein